MWPGLFLAVGIILLYQPSPSCVEAQCATFNPTLPIIEDVRDAGDDNGTAGFFRLGPQDESTHMTTRRVCFLTKVAMKDLDDENEWGQCNLFVDVDQSNSLVDGNWYLRAHAKGSGDGDNGAWCSARCLCWDPPNAPGWCEQTDSD